MTDVEYHRSRYDVPKKKGFMGVSYPVLVTVSTADALRQQADRSSSGAFTALVSTFHLVSQVYEAYRNEGQ